MRKMSKITCIAMALLLSASMLSACEQGNASTEDTSSAAPEANNIASESEETSTAEPTGTDSATIRFMWWGGDGRHEATLAMIEKYMDSNPNVKIEAEYGGWDGYQQKISTQLAGGTAADLMQIDQPWMPNFMAQGDLFVDLNQHSDRIDLSGFEQKFLEDFSIYDGKLVALPSGLNGLSFLANKAVLDEAGVEFGDTITWDDLLTEGKKINAANPDKYMINLDRGVDVFVTKIYLYQKTGKPLINDDYTIAITKEELADALAFTQTLYDEKVIIPLEESMLFQNAPNDNPGWNNNMYGGWLNWASSANLQNWGDNAVALPYPKLADGKDSGYIVRPSQLLGISNNSKYIEQTVDFLDYMLNDEEAVTTLGDCRSIPAVENSRKLLSEKGLVSQVVVDSVDLAVADAGTPESALSTQSEITGVLDTVFEKLIYKQYDANAAADEAFVLWEDVLASLKANA